MTASEADFPPGFELHPTEARNKFAYRMLKRIRAGWKPGEVMTAPNIWRVQGGDRLVLMGRRSMAKSGEFFGLFEFDTCALVYWLTSDRAMPDLEQAMGVCHSCEDALHAGWMRTAFEFVQSRGTSRVIDTEWRLG